MVNYDSDAGPSFITVNGTLTELQDLGDGRAKVLLNGTVIYLRTDVPYRDSELNELLYVIIVIVFYATALMTLIITQIKRQRREGQEVNYYDEYLQRNSEVKQTCQVVNNKLSRRDSAPPPAIASAAFAAVTAGTILSHASAAGRENCATSLLAGEGIGAAGKMAGVGAANARTGLLRDSPLESIPDEDIPL